MRTSHLPDPFALLREAAPWLGLAWSETVQERFRLYLTTLQRWNRTVNLTGEEDDATLVRRHFLDSLTALPLLEECVAPLMASPLTALGGATPTLIDVGAGAGFPGLPLQIARPTWRVTLLEASQKRVHFLRHLCYELGLTEVQVLHGRAEEVGQWAGPLTALGGGREQFDVALARAVADLRVLAEYGLPLVRVGGYFVAYKGPNAAAECAAAESAVARLGGGPPCPRPVPLTWDGEPWPGMFVQIEKVQPTPPSYPRRPGVPAKRPLT